MARTSTSRPFVSKLLSVGRLCLVAGLAYACGNANLGRPAVAVTQAQSAYLPFDQMSRVLVLVEHNYVEPAQREKLLDGAMRGMVVSLCRLVGVSASRGAMPPAWRSRARPRPARRRRLRR